ncbi:hypothetical protein AW168_30695 [Nocardia brasiliensis]|uniref:DUF3558 domain-containing protein n=1 Tax=Nocardia brasiliensis (strain ATCC 700358 / HUJEG-1) TaxID=1133849 RepID=K0EZF3_NOCB7|nr:hypothetical protein O3I_022695 [Nocardia brasiliensis ATCC 700358]OCF86460.1 hypothetical protein AW168_30695 [Nocardia brasiliensis]
MLAGVLVATACSGGGPEGPRYATGFTALPASCAEVGAIAADALRGFAATLPATDAQLFTKHQYTTAVGGSLECEATFEDPIPRPGQVAESVPLSRAATIRLLFLDGPTLADRSATATTSAPPGTATVTPLPGIGDSATAYFQPTGDRRVAAMVSARVANLSVFVQTAGLDWSAASGGTPTGDSPKVRTDLAGGARSIAEVLTRSLSASLPRRTLDSIRETTPEPATSVTTAAPQPVWDPCGIPDDDVTAAGLDPRTKSPTAVSEVQGGCGWSAGWYDVDVYASNRRFTEFVYDSAFFLQPVPIAAADRRAVLARRTRAESSCSLLFDVPQQTSGGVDTGIVELEASAGDPARGDELCTALAGLAVPLSAHFPAGR